MKKRIVIMLLTAMLAATTVLAGCGGKDAEKQLKYKELGISQMEAGSFDEAAVSFQQALDESNGSISADEIDLCYYKALAQFKAGEEDAAIETCSGLIEYDAKNWEAYYLRGRIYLAEKKAEDALADFAKANELNASDISLCTNIYEDLLGAEMENEALGYKDKALAITPSSADDFYNLGDLYYLLEDYGNAETNLKAAQERGNDRAMLLLGQVYAAQERLDEAEAIFAQYMDKYPEDAAAINELGEVAIQTGDYEKAVEYLTKAQGLATDSLVPAILKNLTVAYENLGEWKKAADTAKEYLKLTKDSAMEREYAFLQNRVKGLNATQNATAEVEVEEVAEEGADEGAQTQTEIEDNAQGAQ